MNLFYNPETKIIFGSNDTQPVGMNLITSNDVADLIANGATVDSSADSLLAPLDAGNGVADAPAPDASATGSDTAEAGNVGGSGTADTSAAIAEPAMKGTPSTAVPSAGADDAKNVSGAEALQTGLSETSITGTALTPISPASGSNTQAIPISPALNTAQVGITDTSVPDADHTPEQRANAWSAMMTPAYQALGGVAAAHPAHGLANQIAEHVERLEASADSTLVRMAAEVKKLVAQIKATL